MLPLDQTLPVAGFSESAGDSLALIYLIYRDAGEPEQPALVTRSDNATLAAPLNILARPEATATAATVGAGADAVPVDPSPASEPADTVAGYAAAAVLVPALAWLSRGYIGARVRTVLRLLRILDRQPTKGSA